ncbi:MAG: hypothetical protein V2A78_00475 [bacterium]
MGKKSRKRKNIPQGGELQQDGFFSRLVNGKAVFWICLVLLVVCVICYHTVLSDDNDIWYHLKYGQHFFENHTWNIDHTQFSWTAFEPSWKYVNWIADVIFYLVYNAARENGLAIVRWLTFIGIFALFYLYLKSRGDKLDICHLMGFILIAVTLKLAGNYYKPERFSDLFFALTVFLYFYSKSINKKMLFFYPLLFLLWVNSHGGFIVGLAFVILALMAELAYFLFSKSVADKKFLPYLSLSIGASLCACAVNPYGAGYLVNIVKGWLGTNQFGQYSNIKAYFTMWDCFFPKVAMPIFSNASWALLTMGVLFAMLCVYTYRKKNFVDLPLLLINLIFFFFSMKVARSTMFFTVIWFFSSIYILKQSDLLEIKRKFAPIALVIFLFWAYTMLLFFAQFLAHTSWYGSYTRDYTPVKEVEFLRESNLPGPIFNDYVIGGYLIWDLYPKYKVFMDPRYNYKEEVISDYFSYTNNPTLETLRALRARYPFNTAIISMDYLGIILSFLSSPDWKLIYFYERAAVFAHNSVIDKLSLKARTADMDPERFSDVKNPQILTALFNMYICSRLDPEPVEKIVSIFKRNVSNLYRYKNENIQAMEEKIRTRKEQLKQRPFQTR